MRRMGEIPVPARVAWDDGAQEWLHSHDVVRTITWHPDAEVSACADSCGTAS